MKHYYDLTTYKNFKMIEDYTDEEHEALFQTFTVEVKNRDGSLQHLELKPNGDNIDVNSKNVKEYL